MLYREVGEFKTSYAADQQTFPISFDKIAYFIALAIAFLLYHLSLMIIGRKRFCFPFLFSVLPQLGLIS
ncbi:MAG: hypothetical protein CM15mP100_0660 [Alphaproteobacteria bacterium]|nr:MAG: hypothetical protein CM15mP100_0660 [Alphaproteobacteria bacterium]